MAVAMDGRNVQMVNPTKGGVIVLMPRIEMTREEAINLAAWLVATMDAEDDFNETLAAVQDDHEPLGPRAA